MNWYNTGSNLAVCDKGNSSWSIRRKQSLVFALSPVRRVLGLLFKRSNRRYVAGSGGTDEHKFNVSVPQRSRRLSGECS